MAEIWWLAVRHQISSDRTPPWILRLMEPNGIADYFEWSIHVICVFTWYKQSWKLVSHSTSSHCPSSSAGTAQSNLIRQNFWRGSNQRAVLLSRRCIEVDRGSRFAQLRSQRSADGRDIIGSWAGGENCQGSFKCSRMIFLRALKICRALVSFSAFHRDSDVLDASTLNMWSAALIFSRLAKNVSSFALSALCSTTIGFSVTVLCDC